MAITPETIIRRQINYFIIKETWCVFQGPRTQLELYKKLNISRQLYSRIMTGQCDTQLDNQAQYCHENTGISTDAFRGKITISLDGFKYDDWETFFGDTYSKKKSKDYKSFIKKLRNQIANADQQIQKHNNKMLGVDENLKLLIFFAKHGSKEDMLNNYTMLNNVITAIESIDIRFLESVIEQEKDENKYLAIEKYMKALKSQYELTNSVYIYKKNTK